MTLKPYMGEIYTLNKDGLLINEKLAITSAYAIPPEISSIICFTPSNVLLEYGIKIYEHS